MNLSAVVRECMEDGQNIREECDIPDYLVEAWVSKIKKILSNRNRGCAIYIDPKVTEFLSNHDALSTQLTVFRHGGSIDSRKAIPYIPAYQVEE